jgi:3-oxoacyl-[acyl-carrier protein] reductase
MKFLIKLITIFLVVSTAAADTSKSLTGQVAIVWGASQGIGRAIALDLAAKGATTYILARSEDKLKALATEIKQQGGYAKYLVADINKEDQVFKITDQILKSAGKIDILVQNVGIYPLKKVIEMESKFLRDVLETNLVSSFNTTKAVLPAMQKQQYGRIILVSSITGPHTGIPGLSAYGASKAAIQGFIRTAAIEIAPYNITINAVEPGYIKTEGVDHLSADYFNKLNSSVPLGRVGEASEIAYVVSFLASKESSYVTGTSIIIDGGLTLPESHYLHVVTKN